MTPRPEVLAAEPHRRPSAQLVTSDAAPRDQPFLTGSAEEERLDVVRSH
ncbi:hypothetical protein [Aquisphaera insulae]|nr:hypothetical protein [Aquisphaera insulae]